MTDKIPYSPSRLDSTIFFEKNLGSYIKEGKDIIDVGCGKLYLYNFLIDHNISTTYLGIDLDPVQPNYKRKNLKSKIVKADFLKYSFTKKFDIVACLWVLEHICDDDLAIKKMGNLLKKNGILILVVPSIWSWPFEFGRHGFHYYSRNKISSLAEKANFKIDKYYASGGVLGLLFMIFYSWPRYLILIPALLYFLIFKKLGKIKRNWVVFSKDIIYATWYKYHQFKYGIPIHNLIVSNIVKLDNKFKLFPASYILILRK